MKTNIIFVVILMIILSAGWVLSSQDVSTEQNKSKSDKYVKCDTLPSPVAGFEAIKKKLVYPEAARKAGIESKVMIELKIKDNGEIEDTNVIESPAPGNGFEEAALKALKAVAWKPAKKDNEPVSCWITVPVLFKLNDNKVKTSASDKQNEKKDSAAYDEPPKPVGGFSEIGKHLNYPDAARRAGVTGKVLIKIYINEKGEVTATEILESLGEGNGCDDAAIDAIKKTKWIPAKKDDKPVATWIIIPIKFGLS